MPCFLPSEKLGGSLFFFFVMCCWSWCFRGRGAASRPSASLSSCIHSSYVIIILVFVFLLLDPGLLVFPSFTRMSGKSLCGRSYGRARFSFFFFLASVSPFRARKRTKLRMVLCMREKDATKKKKKVHEKERTYLCKSSLSLTLVKPHELMIPGSKKGTRRLCDCCAASSSSHKRKEKRSPLHLSCAELDPTPVGAVFC